MCLAIPGKLISIEQTDDILELAGKVDFGGIVKQVSLSCVPEAQIGQYLLVHVGLAISVIDEQQAQEVFDYLRQAGELEDLEAPDALH